MINMEEIVNKFQTIYSSIRAEKGPFYLFMILKMDELIDKWSVVASASWIKRESQAENFKYITDKIRGTLTAEESLAIARVGTFQPEEHLVRLINNAVRVQGGQAVYMTNNKINGYLIHEAYVFESVPPEGLSTSPSPSPEP